MGLGLPLIVNIEECFLVRGTMDITRSFSLFQILSAIALIIASIFLVLRMRKEIPGNIRNELNRTTSLIFLIFSGYIFFVFIMVGNIDYPIQPITASMLLGSACFVYADIMLIKSLIQTINQKDKEIKQYIADLEREIFDREKSGRRAFAPGQGGEDNEDGDNDKRRQRADTLYQPG